MKGTISREQVITSLRDMGIHKGHHIMLHASLSAIGYVDGGAKGLAEAFIEAVAPEGTMIVPVFRSAIRSDAYGFKDCENCQCTQFCASDEAGTTGAVTEAIRQHPGALRSCHPTSPWAGVGGMADFLLGSHGMSPTQCGKGSPFFKLMELDGWVMLLGVGVNRFTNVHAVEDVLNVPYLSFYDQPRRHTPYTISARRIQYQYPLLLEAALREAGIIREGKLGAAQVLIMKAREIGSFLWKVAVDNEWSLTLRPRGNVYAPFEDACIKVSEMLKVWQADPDTHAWEQLLSKSNEDIIPNEFKPTAEPCTHCPAYAGFSEGYHRCRLNDPPPWENFVGYPPTNNGVATCDTCIWPKENVIMQ
jgi:aminoglycoside 3-N-acetyltransferase